MPHVEQLTVPGTPKKRGGARPGAGRKKTEPETKMIRVSVAMADACKRLDTNYRQMFKDSSAEERSILLALNEDSIVVSASEAVWTEADKFVEDFLAGTGFKLSTLELRCLAAQLLERLMEN